MLPSLAGMWLAREKETGVVDRMLRRFSPFVVMAALLAVAAIGLGACGSSSSSGGSSSASSPASTGTAGGSGAANGVDVPASVKQAGALHIAAFFGYPPYRYIDKNGNQAGIEVQMADAVAKQMGVKADYQNIQFAAIPPAVQNGRFDFAVGLNLPLNKNAPLDTLFWLRSTLVLEVKKGNPSHVNPNDLCTATFGDAEGTVNLQSDKKIAAQCAAEGKPRPTVLTFQDVPTRNEALVTGHTTVALDDPAVIKYESQVQGVPLEALQGAHLSATIAKPIPLGWLFKKGNTQMERAVQQAIANLIKNGTWQRIMKEGGITDPIIPPTFNVQKASQS
jgi:polar amino acid transport system substrate-binding protein